jgi:hypothetical protein
MAAKLRFGRGGWQAGSLEDSAAAGPAGNFGAEAIELEVFAYVVTADFNRFLEVREELLLRIASVVEAAGSGFAPTRFISMQGSEGEARALVSPRDKGARRDPRPAQSRPQPS